MTFYLSSPTNPMQAANLCDMPVLISFASWREPVRNYIASFSQILVDSGAFSVMNSGHEIDVNEYSDWAQQWHWADAVAGLDDISGDWKRSLANYEVVGFPTFHDTDPPELLETLVELARERGGWIGVGLQPPRRNKGRFVRETLERIPDDLHVHGWALGDYWPTMTKIDSCDSTNWLLDARKVLNACPWLTPAESVEIMVKRYQRIRRTPPPNTGKQQRLF